MSWLRWCWPDGLVGDDQISNRNARWMALFIVIYVAAVIILILGASAHARWDGPSGPYGDWFKAQRNDYGLSCCAEADGHDYYGDYRFESDGSVTLIDAGNHKILPFMVLKGMNPTGHAIWWYVESGNVHMDFCFAPGSQG